MLEINKIYNQDCLEGLKNIPDESIDLILTDPPYGIDYLSTWTNNHNKIEGDDFEIWKQQLPIWLKEMKRVLKPTGCCCCCCGSGGKIPVTAIFTIEAIKEFNLIQTLVWRKFIGLGWRYRSSYENIIILSKSKDDYNFYDTSKSCSNVIEGINQEIPDENMHPTHKPVELMKRLIKIHSKENDLVLDMFAGGGSTLVASKQLNRNFIGFEINKKYCDIANKRLQQNTLFDLSKLEVKVGENANDGIPPNNKLLGILPNEL